MQTGGKHANPQGVVGLQVSQVCKPIENPEKGKKKTLENKREEKKQKK